MNRIKGRRYDSEPKLNKKKVLAFIIAIIVIIMVILSLKNLLTNENKAGNKNSLTTYISAFENNKWGVIDNKGKEIIKTEYDEMVIIPNKNKDIFVCIYDVDYENNTYKTKVLDKSGKEILEKYDLVEPLENSKENEVWYEDDVLKFQKDGKYGLINFKGKEILSPEYTNIYALSGTEKSIVIEKEGKKGIFTTVSNDIVVEPKYEEIYSINNNNENGYIVKNPESKYGLISNDKKVILEEKYEEIKNVESKEYFVVKENGILKIVDKNAQTILDSGFDSIEKINSDQFIIIKNGKYGVVDRLGNTVIVSEYEDIKPSISNYYIVKKDGKYGVILTADSSIKVNYEYENISYIKDADIFIAEKSDYTTDIINRNFEKKLEGIIISELNVEDGYIRIRKDGEYKYYNFKFEEKTNLEVLTANTLFLVKENGKYGYVNKNNEKIVDCKYDDAKEQNEFGYCAVKLDGKWGALKSDGTVVLEPSINLDESLYIDFIDVWYRYKELKLNIYTK